MDFVSSDIAATDIRKNKIHTTHVITDTRMHSQVYTLEDEALDTLYRDPLVREMN